MEVIDIYVFESTGNMKKEGVTIDPNINSSFVSNLMKKMGEGNEYQTFMYMLSYLKGVTDYDVAEIWTFSSENKALGDEKQFTFPEKTRSKIRFSDLKHIKNINGPSLTNHVVSNRRKSLKKSNKKALSAPVKIENLGKPKKYYYVLGIPLKCCKSDGTFILVRDRPFTSEDVSKVYPYRSILESLPFCTKRNISGGIVRKVQERDKIKDTFLATVSHELRTPLNGIVGMISMMRDAGPLTEKQNEYLVILMECSHQLMTMLNNMLDFNKMVSNRLALLRTHFDVIKSAKDAVIMTEGKATAKGLKIKTDYDSAIPSNLIGDSQRFIQILTNLLSNGVKFTETGTITLKIYGEMLKDSRDDEYIKKWKINVDVEDTGIGISPEEQEAVFEGFYQSKNISREMTQRGTGLGLSISRELIRMMGGDIQIVSSLGKGTLFSFYIVAEEEIKVDSLKNPETVDLLKKSKILLVDDRPEYRLQITDILFKLGCMPTAVSSGEEVLQYIKYGATFDTIIVDICMPYMSGIELAQALIHDEKINNKNHTPLLALSSVELQAGIELFDEYLSKPIDQNSLFPSLMKCLRSKGVEPKKSPKRKSSLGSREKKTKGTLKILIAEDDPNNSYTLKEMLCHLGYSKENITCVVNGEKCVEEVKKTKYDVILMDIIMPVMDGLEATKYIRTFLDRPYIIAVSAAVQNSDKQRCQQVGIDGYLPKPVLKDKLDAALSPLVD